MQLQAHREDIFDKIAVWFSTGIKIVLSLLMVMASIALVIGIVKSGLDIYHSVHKPLETVLQQVLLDAVFIVALVEIMITILSYLDDGRVHVLYIVDTVLIIMLNEIVSMWFKHPELKNAISLSIIVATLAAIRVSLTKFDITPSKPKG